MSDVAKMLYNVQKFQILDAYARSSENRHISEAYAYAWSEGLYPIGNEFAVWHEPHGDSFKVGDKKLQELADFLDVTWTDGKTVSFYDLEQRYGIRGTSGFAPDWDRADLIHACRYFKLLDWFDDDFWIGLIGGSGAPTEAHSITRGFDPGRISLG
ncbi:hypothetical protein CBI55_03645 [Pseudomonas syringae]|uniref:hypothetical protein n=1 Tax=Pseudomonas syringae TaxID=317 RepID=UPI000C1CA7B3|nr:hypothetical protein [Pseudomonas syringae]PIO96029.1 hypothetical protein CBI55_03645 [Pseudomonas syringae]